MRLAGFVGIMMAMVYGVSDLEGAAVLQNNEQVTIYPTYGYQQGGQWVIPMRVWVHQRRALAENGITGLVGEFGELNAKDAEIFRSRIRDFVADSESGETVIFEFDTDSLRRQYRVQDEQGGFPQTDLNGLIIGTLVIPLDTASQLLQSQQSRDGWLTFQAVSSGHTGNGRVRLMEPEGLSIVSDIDDTVKITNIPAGAKEVVKNTFFREFRAAPGMAELYRSWDGAGFHFVSGGPWQMYGPLSEFLFSEKTGFPKATFHMKSVRKNLFSAGGRQDLQDLTSNENLTYEQKISQIGEILRRFPRRKFILIGDSGEKDPEVYREIAKQFPSQVKEIRIRDVINERKNNPDRLAGMIVIVTDPSIE
jgi:hypothetical protein